MDQASKEAWQWVENTEADAITDEHVQMSYRLKVGPCKPGKCKKNCRTIPRCLVGLGEKVWLEDLKLPEDKPEDPCNIVRDEGAFVGLTNLGATCYINSLLQLWFHNANFRRAVYAWDPAYDSAEKENKTLPGLGTSEGFQPTSPIGNLQLLFALMQFSKRSCVNPTSFITSLGIDTTTQQDAQEFSKLFVCMLEEALSQQKDTNVSTMVPKQFRGQYEYVTRCCKCETESTSPSPFYELDLSLQGNNTKGDITLGESLNEFLREEKLEGNDQYLCGPCGSKQNATRSIRLKHLPPVLNIQLLRFVFDRKTGHKKKVSSVVHFPQVLDMANYVHTSAGSSTYDLAAVLIHRGPSAYSGHYVAHIKDQASSSWYKFNDEVVQKLEGSEFQLGVEGDLEESKKGKNGSAKAVKGSIASSNAYMLVYCRREVTAVKSADRNGKHLDDESILPPWIRSSLQQENDTFNTWSSDVVNRKDEDLKNRREKHAMMRRIYQKLPSTSLQQDEFISTQWLSSWLNDDEQLGSIDNSHLLCSHAKLNSDKFREYRLISHEAANELYNQYKGGPRLGFESLCWDCVRSRCNTTRLKAEIDADSKIITNLMKAKIEPNELNYWVGKDSHRSWKKLVMERRKMQELESARANQSNGVIESKNSSDGERDISSNGRCSSSNGHSKTVRERKDSGRSGWQVEFDKTLSSEDRPSSSASTADFGFNDDLLCDHNQMSPDENLRKLVQPAVWKIFQKYFPEALEYTSTDSACEECLKRADVVGKTKELQKIMALEQKSLLGDVFKNKNRPDPILIDPDVEIYAVARQVIEKWRAFIRDPVRKQQLNCLENELLLCHHRGLLHRPNLDVQSETKFAYLWPVEWETLARYANEKEIAIRIIRKPLENGSISMTTDPAVCESCFAERVEEERRSQLDYVRAGIFVRQVGPGSNESLIRNILGSGNAAEASFEQEDPDYQITSGPSESKKPRLDNQVTSVIASPSASSSPSASGRRSQRARRGRGEKEITVSSDQTLLELKREIMRKFQVAPFDQHLTTCDGRDLNDNQATLAALRIYPGTTILLQADEPSEDPALMEDYARTAQPEEGFKGTGLLRS